MSNEQNQNLTLLSEEEANTEIKGVTVADIWRALVITERLAKTGNVEISEYIEVYQFYETLKRSIKNTLGKSVDEIIQEFQSKVMDATKNKSEAE